MKARAAVFDGPKAPFRLIDLPLPTTLHAGEVLVQLTLATICGSDLHTYEGRREEPVPSILGHEGIGRVVAVGAGREAWLDKRVTWTSADSCGGCPACLEWDLPQKCARLFKYGHASLHEGSGLHGTYATHIVLRGGTLLVELPDGVADAAAVSANCSLATMVHAIEQRPAPCRVAVVQGAGLLGLHACALLRAAGVSRVFVVDVDDERLQRARLFGGEPCASHELPARSADLVLEVAGAPALMDEALRLLRPGGHCVLVGMVHPHSALSVTGESLIRGSVTVRGVHNYAPRHLAHAVRFLSHSALPWGSLVSPPLPLEQLDDAFALAATRRWVRVAVSMSAAS